jgi:pSer/pThr/pTyr-binding forkhead associated (FHA) protein
MTLTLEIVEGPGAGATRRVTAPLVIGRGDDADLRLDDTQASRRHARVTPTDDGAVVEDLDSTNGTFVNRQAVHGTAPLAPGDELVVGVTVMQLRSAADVDRHRSAVRAVPPPLAAMQRRPTYVDRVEDDARADSGIAALERLRDRRTKAQARIAPVSLLAIAGLAVVVYLGLR